MDPISATNFMARLNSGEQLNVLDVREELEYLTYNIGGKNIPLSKLSSQLDKLGYNKTDELIVICTMGKRSETARILLNENGYVNARNLSGGLIAIQKDQQ
ncbi:adenylyltransferase and sulfurtransferase [Mucilaginibacter mallensis]|uniref:Adenylyltransferase and sulfurtransferase n=1 Tax=Mucilaginibacter mallensis TaxID=652787 RepID=A0A1H1WJ21_MUCMA|nr:rhodanese-like domain-containing protein [Mucilaginibacter mallensis]SDS97317.1 adenylyltransferase and sulfurtransferase [Mucilaginibacter mallensis]